MSMYLIVCHNLSVINLRCQLPGRVPPLFRPGVYDSCEVKQGQAGLPRQHGSFPLQREETLLWVSQRKLPDSSWISVFSL